MSKQRNSTAQRLRGIGLVLVVLTVTACGGDGGEAQADDEAVNQTPQYGGSLTVGVEAESNCWTPNKGSWGRSGQTISRTIFDSLMIRAEDGSTVPMLAESLESNEDFTEWTLTLRPDITFHDGTALTADVLVTIFNDYLKVPGSVTASSLTGATIAAVDEMTVVYTLAVPNAAFFERLTGNVGMPFSIEAVQRFGEDKCANPVGAGPFVFQEWVVDDRLIVTRNEDYWWQADDAPPYLDEIVFRVITDSSAMLATFLTGRIEGGSWPDLAPAALNDRAAQLGPEHNVLPATVGSIELDRGGRPVTEVATLAAELVLEPSMVVNGGWPPGMPADDFARYLEIVPGAYAGLGVGSPGSPARPIIHNSDYLLDESGLSAGVAWYLSLVLNFERLRSGGGAGRR